MSGIQVGDTVVFRQRVRQQCNSAGISAFRAKVVQVTGEWLFMTELGSERMKVMHARDMCKLAKNGAVLELV